MDENSLTHYGVLGMKWGRRKSKVSKGSNVKKKSSKDKKMKQTSSVKKTKKILTDSRKQNIKSIAKTTAKVAGAAATAAILGYVGVASLHDYADTHGTRIEIWGATNPKTKIEDLTSLYYDNKVKGAVTMTKPGNDIPEYLKLGKKSHYPRIKF